MINQHKDIENASEVLKTDALAPIIAGARESSLATLNSSKCAELAQGLLEITDEQARRVHLGGWVVVYRRILPRMKEVAAATTDNTLNELVSQVEKRVLYFLHDPEKLTDLLGSTVVGVDDGKFMRLNDNAPQLRGGEQKLELLSDGGQTQEETFTAEALTSWNGQTSLIPPEDHIETQKSEGGDASIYLQLENGQEIKTIMESPLSYGHTQFYFSSDEEFPAPHDENGRRIDFSPEFLLGARLVRVEHVHHGLDVKLVFEKEGQLFKVTAYAIEQEYPTKLMPEMGLVKRSMIDDSLIGVQEVQTFPFQEMQEFIEAAKHG